MTLPFMKTLNDKPTYFVEKITSLCMDSVLMHRPPLDKKGYEYMLDLQQNDFNGLYSFDWKRYGQMPPKFHTIRLDDKNRWKKGNLIHPVINNRSKNQLQFCATMICTGTQQIDLLTDGKKVWQFYIDKRHFGSYGYGDKESLNNVQLLARNDGFDTAEEFLQYFNKPFSGKIIHWTNLKY